MNDRLASTCHGLIIAVIVGWLLWVGKFVFVPLVFGVLVAYVIVGLTRLSARIPVIGARLPTAVRYILSITFIGAVLVAVALMFIAQFGKVTALAPQYQATLLTLIQQGAVTLGIEAEPTWTTMRRDVLAQVNLQRIAGLTAVRLTSLVGGLVVVLLYVAFLLVERGVLPGKIDRLAGSDPARTARIHQIIDGLNNRIGAYLALKTLVNLATGVITWAILAALGVEFAVFWGVLVFVLNYIPYVGTLLSIALPVLFAVVQFGDMGQVLVLLACLSVAQFFTGHFLDPYVMGQSLNLSPLVILIALAVWAALWGIPGAFLAVPLTACLVMVLAQFDGTRRWAVMLSRRGEV